MQAKTKTKKIKATLLKSKYGRKKGHLACITGLGLRKIHQSVILSDTPAIRGMIDKISYLLKVEENY